MQKANIALISTLYNTRGADFYKDIYFPVIKYAAMNIYYESDSSEKYYDITALQDSVAEKIGITIPLSVLRNSIKSLSRVTDSDVMVELYQKGDYFVIRRNWDISINHSLEQEANTLSTSFREVEICFNQFLEVEQLSSSKTFSDLFTESSEDVVNYINAEGTTNSINENYVNVIRFIKWLKDANPHYYSVVNTLLWGAIVAGFLQRKKIDPNIKIVDSVDYYLDTSIALSVLGLDSEENILYARDLVRIILDSGSTPCVHALTLREISRILRRVEIDQGPKPGTSIQHAWAEQGLCLSDILKIKNNLESKLQDEFNIAVSNMASHLLDKIEEKYKNNMDVRALAKNRGSHSEDKLRDIHDVYMRDYVNEINQVAGAGVLEKQTAFFVSLNNDMIAFANHEGQLENVIHASRVVMSLWIHSCSSHNIQRLALTETISRCFALNQTDVRRKLRLFQKYYSDCSFTKDDVSNMYTSLIRRSTQTITEVERIKSIEETDVENKDVVCQEIIQGVVQAVKKEAEERANAMSSMKTDIDNLSKQIGNLDIILQESKIGHTEKDSLIEQLRKEAEIREKISGIKDKINEYEKELIPLKIQRDKSVCLFKFWITITLEILALIALIFFTIKAIINWDKANLINYFNIATIITFIGLIYRINNMYLLSLGPSKAKVRKEQLDCWDLNNPRKKEIEDKIKGLEIEKKKLERI